jgi:hypothetical protein
VLVAHRPQHIFCSSRYCTGPPGCAKSCAKKQPRGGEHAGEKRRPCECSLSTHHPALCSPSSLQRDAGIDEPAEATKHPTGGEAG